MEEARCCADENPPRACTATTSSGALEVHFVSIRSLLDRPRIDSRPVQRHVRDCEKEKPGYLPQCLKVVTAIGTELQISFALFYERRGANAIESRG
jgi:hypothetical protein